jgi:hypothetical protein
MADRQTAPTIIGRRRPIRSTTRLAWVVSLEATGRTDECTDGQLQSGKQLLGGLT